MGEPLTIRVKVVGPDGESFEDYMRAIVARIKAAGVEGSSDPVTVSLRVVTGKDAIPDPSEPPGPTGREQSEPGK